MKDAKYIPLAFNPEGLDDDILDELFGQLEQFQPPASLLHSIMETVSQLPPFSSRDEKLRQEDTLTIHRDLPM